MIIKGKDSATSPCVATIGSFDGVHQGHKYVLSQLIRLGQERMLDTLAVSFSNHPAQVLHPDYQPQMLSTTEEKTDLLLATGIDRVALLEFSKNLAAMSARDFMQSILKDTLQVRILITGYDNHFGHDRCGFEQCRQYGEEMGIEVVSCKEWTEGEEVSSTTIRNSLLSGNIQSANSALGYNYFLQGQVVQGFQNGRKMGFPTANLCPVPSKLIPEDGVYLVTALVNGKVHTGMMNIGTRPTLHNGSNRSLEVHILDFHGDLYGKSIKVEFIQRLRREQQFDSIAALANQLQADEAMCRLLSEKL